MVSGRTRHLLKFVAALSFFALALTATGGRAGATTPVDLELVLAIDISRSVDDDEARLQREGYAAAFRDPGVIDAIRSGAVGAIAVAYVEWAGAGYQRTVIDWTLIKDPEAAAAFAAKVVALPRNSAGWTSISGAIDYCSGLFGNGGFAGSRRVIDISGDGPNNNGRPAHLARDDATARGIVINGLPILNDRLNFGRTPEVGLDAYYEDEVIGGAGSFSIVAKDFHTFAAAILAKLIREIAALPRLGDARVN